MKKVFLTLSAVLMGMMTTVNAQLVVGGDIKFGGNGTKAEKSSIYGVTEKEPTDFNFTIGPKVGYMFMEGKMEAGASLNFIYDQSMTYLCLFDKDGKGGKAYKNASYETFKWSIDPYLRGRVVAGKGFGLWFEGVASLGTTMDMKEKSYAFSGYDEDGVKKERTKEDIKKAKEIEENVKKEMNYKHSVFNGSFTIKPVLTYDINEHWRLEAGLNFLQIGIAGSVETEQHKNIIEDKVEKVTTNNYEFVLGAFGSNVANSNWFKIGAAYKF